ncbi:hypothetical protein A4G20_06670 [Pasteurellaceae bacterium RH1A]|nr:hypothetical protein A4G20_06670 [Pasteurellaceae bacterium RH1A]
MRILNKKHPFNENNKRIIEIDQVLFSFRGERFNEVLVDKKVNKNIEIYISDFCITNKEDLLVLKNEYSFIERRDGRIVFNDLGFSVDRECKEYYFFHKDLLPFWSNPYRPITSW